MNKDNIAKFLDLANFLLWLEMEKPNEMWGGVKIEDAVEGLISLSGFTRKDLNRVIFQNDDAS